MAHLTLLRAFLIALALVGCVEQPLPTNRPVQIALNWFPEQYVATPERGNAAILAVNP